MKEIKKADPVARRKSMLLAAAGFAAGIAIVGGVERYRTFVQQWVTADPSKMPERMKWLILGPVAASTLVLITMAFRMWWLGGKVLRAKEYPPPDYPVARDTRISRGAPAIRRGAALRVTAVFIAVITAGLWWLSMNLAAAFSQLRPRL